MSDVSSRWCDVLDWDSQFWGLTVARLRELPRSREDLVAITEWCSARGVDLVMALVPASSTSALALLSSSHFEEMDRRLTLVGTPAAASASTVSTSHTVVRVAHDGDKSRLGDIASVSHRDTRFYRDRRFPASRADDLYRQWITNDIDGRADIVLCADVDGVVVGYISLVINADRATATISLIAVDPQYVRRGIATSLVRQGAMFCADQGVTSLSVATQRDNQRAMAFYHSRGFRVAHEDVWLHRWT